MANGTTDFQRVRMFDAGWTAIEDLTWSSGGWDNGDDHYLIRIAAVSGGDLTLIRAFIRKDTEGTIYIPCYMLEATFSALQNMTWNSTSCVWESGTDTYALKVYWNNTNSRVEVCHVLW